MTTDDIAFLISPKYEQDEYGIVKATKDYRRRQIYVRPSSITRAEWYDGGRNGLNPELRLETFSADYEGEEIIEYHDRRYTTYRTYYSDGDTIELYCELRKGRDGNQEG